MRTKRSMQGLRKVHDMPYSAWLGTVGWLFVVSIVVGGMTLRSEARGVESGVDSMPKHYQFVNGRWFDGHQFRQDTFYAVDGRLTRKQPAKIDAVVDLHGGFVVPPFGEAHNHNVNGPWGVDEVIRRYLKDGVFYVKIPGDIGEFTAQIRQKINQPTSIDVTFSHGGLTATGGHPISLYEDILRHSRYEPVLGPLEKGWFNNRSYFIVDTEADLLGKWNTIMAGKPDFIKTFLVGSEPDDTNRDHAPVHTRKGLDPTLLPRIVALAHRDGLRVSTHVETAGDFHRAVMAGVDEINHLPGWLVSTPHDAENARLSDDDARRAVRQGVVVVTTTVSSHSFPGKPGHPAHSHAGAESAEHSVSKNDSAVQALAREIQIHNLRVLHRHGVAIAIGSDHAETSLSEALNLHALNVFDNLTLLKMWCEVTPRTIFPGKAIGRLDEGYEASFLVLKGNPIERFESVTEITFRIKQGHVLSTTE